MTRQRLVAAGTAAAGLLLLAPAAAHGNTGVPLLFTSQGGLTMLLATVLVAVLERPFVSRAGVERRALLHSIVANVASGVLGVYLPDLASAVRLPEPDDLTGALVLLLLVGLALSILVESAYYWLAAGRGPRRLRWRWVALGNVASLLALVLLNGLLLLAAGA